jgi:hypothetical protein
MDSVLLLAHCRSLAEHMHQGSHCCNFRQIRSTVKHDHVAPNICFAQRGRQGKHPNCHAPCDCWAAPVHSQRPMLLLLEAELPGQALLLALPGMGLTLR